VIPIKLKDGVKLTELQPQMVLALLLMLPVAITFGFLELVVTSGNDGRHSARSWHYKGRAFDIRTHFKNIDGREIAFRNAVKAVLGDNFDVVMEAIGTDNEHLHVEYDPK
jgi:hypothetical protein